MFKNINKISLAIALVLSIPRAQDVTIVVEDTVFSGYTDDIVVPVAISNPNGNVGGVQFDVSVSPNMVPLSGVSALGIASNFSAHFSALNNGNSRVIFYNGNDPDGLNEFYRQFPRTEEHAFRDETKNSIFNLVKIYEQIDYNEEMYRTLGVSTGSFQWVNGVKDSSVIFYPDPQGRFKVSWVPPTHIQNKIIIKNGTKYPGNDHMGAFGCDSYDISGTVDGKGSKGALHGLTKFKNNNSFRFSLKIVISMIPAALVGVMLNEEIENLFGGPIVFVGAMLILTGFLLFLADNKMPAKKTIDIKTALLIGIAQAIAILPGISRSGATISASVLLGIDKEKSARFSFLMVIPLIFGKIFADVLSGEISLSDSNLLPVVVGFISAFFTGILACKWMIKLVKNSQLKYFAYYCFIVGGIVIISACL